MNDKRPGGIGRFFKGLWGALNFLRLVAVNLVFVILVVLFVAALRGGATNLKDRTALVLDPKGNIVEQYTAEPAERAFSSLFGDRTKEVQLRDIVATIDAAAKDSRIERLVIKPDEIESAGFSTLREIGAAVDRFRKSGKDVVAVANNMTQGQYYLAAHADEILLHPQGAILLEGLGRYRTYYKDLLDKLGVAVHLFRVGEYKSAAEPYVRNDSSAEAKEADLYWMNGIWGDYLKDVAAARKLDPAALTADIQNYPDLIKSTNGDLAALALKEKLVDKLATRDEARAMLVEKGVAEHKTFRQIDFQDYARLVEREQAIDTRPQVAVVVAEGEIVDGDQAPGTVGGDSTSRLIRQAREDDAVKAVVLRVNSPGGEVFASELIRREVELTRTAGKPVVVSMGDVAASGGYWISMNANRIFAEPTTITGSIGIFGLIANFPDTLAKIGVHTDGVGTTPFAGAFDVRRPLDPKIGDVIQTVIDKGYRDFVGNVAKARNKKPEEIDAIARGRVWSGEQAKERGLVDELGGLNDAAAAAAQAANLGSDYHLTYVEKELTFWERLALSFNSEADARVARAVVPQVGRDWLEAPTVRDNLRLLRSVSDGKIGVFAYCFCEIR
ncbi:MAG TPA: signal peptide peptidase SppA [Rudaea sp.]|nr:signal peptide peptidase SppA [Rudaea sp.]